MTACTFDHEEYFAETYEKGTHQLFKIMLARSSITLSPVNLSYGDLESSGATFYRVPDMLVQTGISAKIYGHSNKRGIAQKLDAPKSFV